MGRRDDEDDYDERSVILSDKTDDRQPILQAPRRLIYSPPLPPPTMIHSSSPRSPSYVSANATRFPTVINVIKLALGLDSAERACKRILAAKTESRV